MSRVWKANDERVVFGDFVVFADGESGNDNHHCLRQITEKSTALQSHFAPDLPIAQNERAELM